MKNPLFKLYEKLDEGIMYAVNKGVKAWNWTTGKQKTDLANFLLTGAPLLEVGGIYLLDYNSLPFFAITFPFLSYVCSKKNRIQERQEEQAAKKGLKLPRHMFDNNNKFWGSAWIGIGGAYSLHGSDERYSIVGVGHMARGLSHYVMCADDFPKKKNVLSRAKDKLVDRLFGEIKVGQAEPAKIPVKYSSNFNDYFL